MEVTAVLPKRKVGSRPLINCTAPITRYVELPYDVDRIGTIQRAVQKN
jgi:hypothetical protein